LEKTIGKERQFRTWVFYMPIRCQVCNRTFPDEFELVRHEIHEHRGQQRKSILERTTKRFWGDFDKELHPSGRHHPIRAELVEDELRKIWIAVSETNKRIDKNPPKMEFH